MKQHVVNVRQKPDGIWEATCEDFPGMCVQVFDKIMIQPTVVQALGTYNIELKFEDDEQDSTDQ